MRQSNHMLAHLPAYQLLLCCCALQEFLAFAVSEGLRNDNQDKEKRLYPGGAFDPLGFSKDAASFETYKLKEIKNGRLAMVAFLGEHARAVAVMHAISPQPDH
jgi:hypothetical protein